MDFSTKIEIGKLQGKENWSTWKYKVTIMLEGTTGAIEAVKGELKKPILAEGASDADITKYNTAMASYRKAESCALLMLTSNMSEDTLKKVLWLKTAREVWLELHKLYDGQAEDKAYELCLQFFGHKYNKEDDIPTLISRLKNIWNDLNIEVRKIDKNAKLPEMFLICKILDALDEKYYNFKTSWLMLKQNERTIDSLTTHLCTFERSLGSHDSQEALVTLKKNEKKDELICSYCSKKGHKFRTCWKWSKDGKPSLTTHMSESSSRSTQVQQISLMVGAYTIGRTQDRENWFVDNGATTHIAVRSDFFKEFHEFDSDHTVTTADGTTIPAIGMGTVVVESNVNGTRHEISLKNVWLVPSLTKNLFSTLAAQDRVQNSVFLSTTTECRLDVDGTTRIVGKRVKDGGLYKLALHTILNNKLNVIEVNAVTGSNLLQVYHERFAHQDKKHVREIVKRELGIDLKSDEQKCEGCIYGKFHRQKFGTRERATVPGQLIHTDVCGPFADSISKYKYFVLFKDDFSSYRFVYFIKQKSEVKDKLLQMLLEVQTTGHTVNTLLSDNGGEFDNEAVRKILQKHGIQQRLTMPYTPEQNGCSERENRTLVEAARSMMYTRGQLPQVLWAELINTAAYVLNRTAPTRVKGKVPFELWHGKKPRINHLKIIGSQCYAHIPKQNRNKLQRKATKGLLIGYENDDGYRVWDGRKTIRSRDIVFETDVEFKTITTVPTEGVIKNGNDEHDLINEQVPNNVYEPVETVSSEGVTLDDDEHFITQEPQNLYEDNELNPVFPPDLSENQVQFQIEERIIQEDEDEFTDAIDQIEIAEPQIQSRYNLRDRERIRRPRNLEECVNVRVDDDVPETYKDAIESNENLEWRKAMEGEMKSLADNKVWTLCELPPTKKALPCKWVYRIKRNPNGTIEKYKARLVVKGYKQRKGVDYEQTFSPVTRMATIRALLSVAAKDKLYLTQFDVTTAFLNGKLEEDIYMEQPEGFSDGTTNVCKLQRSLYGLKQAPRCWNSCFEEILLNKNFVQNEADSCLYVKKVGDKKIIVCLYVDDGLVAATDKELADEFLKDLENTLNIKVMPASYYLGLEIEKLSDGSIVLSQKSYTRKLLERFRMVDCNPVSTPVEKTIETGKVDDQFSEQNFPYREAVGALAYLMTGTRPDIAYAVGLVSRKLANPTKADWLKVKRIFRYLKGTYNYGIKYSPDCKKRIIEGYSDADHAGDEQTGRSTTGVTCLFAGGAVSWFSQRQPSVAISTTEAEIVAASEGARELIWLQRIFNEITNVEDIPTLKVDNEAAVRLSKNPEFHKRTKHIRVRHFFVRETVQEGLIDVQRTRSSDQLADLLTKAVTKATLDKLRTELGLLKVNNN